MNELVENGVLVEMLQEAMQTAENGLDGLPNLVKEILRKEAWKDRMDPKSSKELTSQSFAEFLSKPLREGLGASLTTLKNLCRDDIEALNLLDEATQNPTGVYNINTSRPAGTSRQHGIRSLRKHRPDLLKLVERGDLSVNRAMIVAHLRRPPTPLQLLKSAWRKASEEERSEFLAEVANPANH